MHLYEEVGRLSLSDMLNKLRGMFGFAIYDATEGKLVLARDQFGIAALLPGRAGRWQSADSILRFRDQESAAGPALRPCGS